MLDILTLILLFSRLYSYIEDRMFIIKVFKSNIKIVNIWKVIHVLLWKTSLFKLDLIEQVDK